MAKKAMIYKEEDGTQYKISFSEELQMKNLNASRRQLMWQKRNFYAKMALTLVLLTLTASMLYLVYRLDAVDFFTKVMYG